MELTPPALRVLGALIEKELATPQGYPLSLNALRTACNQTTNRDPVVDYDEATVRAALDELSALDLVSAAYAARSNTPKYAHQLADYLEVGTDAVALLGVLMLRGPQTVGELRQRTDRLHAFADLGEVHRVLADLQHHPLQPLTAEVPRQPGQKEGRWRHLLGGAPGPDALGADGLGDDGLGAHVPPAPAAGGHPAAGAGSAATGEVAALREEVAELRDEVATLVIEIEQLRRRIS